MPTATNDGVDLVYAVAGPSDAPPFVFVEGLGFGRWMWRWQRAALTGDYRTVVPDNRGTGDSDAPPGPYSIDDLASDLEAVLADAGVERAHLVGASMGGMIVQRYALEYERAGTCTLLCTTPGGPAAEPVPEETRERMFDVPDDGDERETIRHRMAPAVSNEFYEERSDLVERIVDWRLEHDASERARAAQAEAALEFDASDELGALEAPTLVLHGSEDRVVPVENARLLEDRLPNARLEVCEGGHHLFFVEEATWVNDRLREFLAANPLEDGGARPEAESRTSTETETESTSNSDPEIRSGTHERST